MGPVVSDEQYRLLFDANPHPMFVVDVETLAFLAVNEAAVRKYGWSRAEFLAMNLRDIRPPEDLPLFEERRRQLGARGVDEQPWRHRLKDGRVIDVRISSQEISFAGRRARLSASTDVTGRLAAEAALGESERRYRSLAENAAVGIWELAPGGATSYVNPALCRMLEVDSPSDVLGRSYAEFFTPESNARIAAEHAKRAHGVSSTYEVEMVGRRGARRRVVISGSPVLDSAGRLSGVIGTLMDVSSLRRAEVALESQTRVLEGVLTSMSDGVVVVDEAGKFLLFNPAAQRIAGVGAIETSPASWQADYGIFRPDGKTPFPTDELPLVRAMRGESPDQVVMFLRNAARPDGVFVSISGRPIRGEAGEPRGAVVVFRDITHQRALEERLREGHKMEAIGRLAGGLAHDFGTMIAAIRCYARALLRDLPAADAKRADAEQIVSAADHATRLSRRLLDFSRGTPVAPRDLDLNEALRAIEPLLRPLAGRAVDLRIEPRAERPVVRADPGQVEQVILNLVVNARDAMPRGGRLTVETSNADVGPEEAAATGLARPGPCVRLAVSDTGAGMDAETRSRLFEPYFTTKPEGQGTGLGLFTAYGIVKQAGGHISVRSAPGRGTTFEVLLPCVEGACAPARAPRRRAARKKVVPKRKRGGRTRT